MTSLRMKQALAAFVILVLDLASFGSALFSGLLRASATSSETILFSANRAIHEAAQVLYAPVYFCSPGVRWAGWGELQYLGV